MPIERIARLDDPRVADYAHVGEPHWLMDRGLFVAEGRFVVRRLFEARAIVVRSVLVTRPALSALGDILDSDRCDTFVCEQHTMNELAGFNFHRGCLAMGERPPVAPSIDPFLGMRRLLALEGVTNPDNVGGLFRVSAALGAQGVLLDSTSGDPLYRKAIRTSMGAVFRVPFIKASDWLSKVGAFRNSGADVVALTPDSSAVPLRDYVSNLPPDRRVVLLLGAEGPGLSQAAMSIASASVRIPITERVDSLNVVVAAGIALAALP